MLNGSEVEVGLKRICWTLLPAIQQIAQVLSDDILCCYKKLCSQMAVRHFAYADTYDHSSTSCVIAACYPSKLLCFETPCTHTMYDILDNVA